MLDEGTHFLQSDSSFCVVPWHALAGVENSSIAGSVGKFCRLPRAEMETLSRQVELKYLLAILNSSHARKLLQGLRGGDYHIYPEHIRHLPIPLASPAQQTELAHLADQMLTVQRQLQSPMSVADRYLLEQRAELMDRQIDERVTKLYETEELT